VRTLAIIRRERRPIVVAIGFRLRVRISKKFYAAGELKKGRV
jgi:hypothetical protein